MQYAICNLGTVGLRAEPAHTAEMVSQLLYGETFKVLEERAKWSRIRTSFEALEAWIENNQLQKITEVDFENLTNNALELSADLMEFVMESDRLIPIPLGSVLNGVELLGHQHSGLVSMGNQAKEKLIETAFLYLNAPFLWGGKTPMGIDASGFTQMVYKLNGCKLSRNAADQARQGESLSFIEESEPGDLAFFDGPDGVINHVGIMMRDNYIIHADGKVRLDRIDHSGIYNSELRKHTHKLRVIKKII
ncbi:C40 family peptidase [Salinimicrobium sp. TH3]|uniref:C40 family peptidase n=1 Tax=Salinimicrobium sp. TH3 TaxID=2997342 RepID=UPI002274A4E1|nr:C40 family peptidase [Salinimicrobium sp. TH3]MCY2687222.1 C40 family peptidase [Salinimicrobium sp. TH3]